MNDDILFYRKGSLHDFLEAKKLILRTEIESQDSDYLLNVSEEDFCQYLLKKYSIQPPELKEDETYIQDHGEARIDVSQDYRRGIFDRDRPFYIKGTQVTIAIPFKGDSGLFQYQPNLISSPPRGKILGQEVHLVYETVDHDSEKLKSRYNADIKRIKEWLRWVQNAVDNFNQSLEPLITQTVKKRKEKLLKDQGMVAKLGIPIKKSEDLPKTYSIPLEQKELKIAKPAATTEPFEPEPALDIEKYENVLETIQHMTFVMERNPKTFSNLKEEQIRDLFLMILNANYKGQATGETFNCTGKTDILLRVEGRNAFISENKIWKGKKGLLDAIEQLLGYTSWRDTKTAILLFNKDRNFSTVLGQIDEIMKSHSCYKREHKLGKTELDKETTFSYIFHHPDDPNRELFLTVMAFDIPSAE